MEQLNLYDLIGPCTCVYASVYRNATYNAENELVFHIEELRLFNVKTRKTRKTKEVKYIIQGFEHSHPDKEDTDKEPTPHIQGYIQFVK